MTAEQTTRQQVLADAALRAGETVRRETYRAMAQPPVVLREQQIAELRRQCEAIAAQMHTIGVYLAQAWQPVIEAAVHAVTEWHQALVEAGMVAEVEPTDPAARALHRRRHRNTGPQQRQRAPRRIDPRGCQ